MNAETVIPEIVPARMINEFVYCGRLFHLEWVGRQWADSDDTVEGDFVHRNVDKPTGAVHGPDSNQTMKARSVPITSTRLGLTAVLDVLEGDGNSVCPVDTKKGAPPDNEYRAHDPERIQLCVQGLLLRDAGYTCTEGQLYYATTRERVTVPFTEDLVAQTMSVIDKLKNVASSPTPPAPLVDSPKCPRCSLVGICLPDEINTLAQRQQQPRRILPKDPNSQPLYVTQQGAFLTRVGGRIEVTQNKTTIASLRLIDVSQVAVFGNIQLSTQLQRELFKRDIPILYYSFGGWLNGIAHGMPSKHVELRRRQTALAHTGDQEIANAFINGKIRNSRTLLRRNSRPRNDVVLSRLAEQATNATNATSLGALLGHEGTAARDYFSQFTTMLRNVDREAFDFTERNRRPPKDRVNCLLSFTYALLGKDTLAACIAVGLDPYLGFLHRPRFGRPALALDIAEEFRPLIADSTVISLLNNHEVKPNDFIVRAGGVSLTDDGRRIVIGAYERRLATELTHPLFGYKVSYRRAIDVQTRLLAARVLGDTDAYVPLTTR